MQGKVVLSDEVRIAKVLSSGVKIGATIGQTLLLEYLKQYYGLGLLLLFLNFHTSQEVSGPDRSTRLVPELRWIACLCLSTSVSCR
jgi:hypothetical protein